MGRVAWDPRDPGEPRMPASAGTGLHSHHAAHRGKKMKGEKEHKMILKNKIKNTIGKSVEKQIPC